MSAAELNSARAGESWLDSEPKDTFVDDEELTFTGDGESAQVVKLLSGFNATLDELRSSYSEQPDGSDDVMPPSEHAFTRACELVVDTAMKRVLDRLQDDNELIPRGFVTTDDLGGLRIEWWKGKTHCVHLVVSHEEGGKEYVYSKFGSADCGKLDRPVFPALLAARLRKLMSSASQG